MVKRLSVQELNRRGNRQEIWCMGCGKRLNEMLQLYRGEAFTNQITALLDNSQTLWGTQKQVSGRTITITGPGIIKQQGNQNVLLMISSDHYEEIYESIRFACESKKVTCILYPVEYYSVTHYVMKLCCCLPLKKQLLFCAGKEPHENADAVVSYLSESNKEKDYRVVYLSDRETGQQAAVCLDKHALKTRNTLGNILRYCDTYARSAFLFYENEPVSKVRRSQKLIYLNHGTIPLKNVGDVLRQPNEVDYAICPSKNCSGLYARQYGIPEHKQLYMMPPRAALLFRKPENINSLFPWDDKQVLIWLPTFRQLEGTDRRDSFEQNPIKLLEDYGALRRIDAELNKNRQILMIKHHPREKNKVNIPAELTSVFLLTDEALSEQGVTLQTVLGKTAALITDYSGIAFEYMLLDKPIGYVINDLEDYKRGFAVENPLAYMPGMKIRSVEAFICFLESVCNGTDEYRAERNDLAETIFGSSSPHSGAGNLINFVEKIWRGAFHV